MCRRCRRGGTVRDGCIVPLFTTLLNVILELFSQQLVALCIDYRCEWKAIIKIAGREWRRIHSAICHPTRTRSGWQRLENGEKENGCATGRIGATHDNSAAANSPPRRSADRCADNFRMEESATRHSADLSLHWPNRLDHCCEPRQDPNGRLALTDQRVQLT